MTQPDSGYSLDVEAPAIGVESAPRLRPLTASEFLALDFPPRELILSPWLPRKGLAMLFAPRGIGKTMLALGLAYAAATGSDMLGFSAPKPRRVLYVDGEMPAETMQRRLGSAVKGFENQPPEPDGFRILCADQVENGLPDLATANGQSDIDAAIGDAELVVIDNLSTLVRSGKENEAEGWLPVQQWALTHRRAGRSILFVHHAGKTGAQRGTSKREDVLDTVISLSRPTDYTADQGARFELRFDKARGFHGEAAEPFEVRYEESGGAATWIRAPISENDMARVAKVIDTGRSVRAAAAELGLSKSAVHRLKAQATANGLIG